MESTFFTLSRRAYYGAMILLTWMALPAGVFLLLNQQYLWGMLLSAFGVAAVIGMLSNRVVQSLQFREIPMNRGYLMTFGFASSALITAMFVLLLIQPSRNLDSLGMVYAIGILVLGAWASIQVLRSMRNKGKAI